MSLSQNFLFWQPRVFPTENQNIRDSNVFAVYWADVDNRVEGMCILILSTSRWILCMNLLQGVCDNYLLKTCQKIEDMR